MDLRKFAQDAVQLAQKMSTYSSSGSSDSKKESKKIKQRPEAYVPRYIGVTTPWGVK